MDKRSFSAVVSPTEKQGSERCKKLKVAISPHISPKKVRDENIGNSKNKFQSQISDELDGLCFDDSNDSVTMDKEVIKLKFDNFLVL